MSEPVSVPLENRLEPVTLRDLCMRAVYLSGKPGMCIQERESLLAMLAGAVLQRLNELEAKP